MNATTEERHARGPSADGVLGWLGDVADDACELVNERVEQVTQQAAQMAHDEVERLEVRLRRAAILAGALAAGAALIITGLAGALADLVGRPWIGQIGQALGGVAVIGIVAAWFAWSARAQRRRTAAEAAARAADEDSARRTSLQSMVVVGAAGWIVGQLLARHRR